MSSPADLRPSQEQEERISLGLITYLSRHALDEDYGWVSRNRPGLGGGRARVAATATLAVFGLLVLTAASQTSRSSTTTAREREQLIAQITARRDVVDARLARAQRLVTQNQQLTQTYNAGTGPRAAQLAQVSRLSLLTGATPVRGQGVTVVANDAVDAESDRERVLDKDLQRLVNALWESGAEAISVNGQRLTNLSTIRQAGSAINVNFVPLRPPYTVLAIGDRARIPSRFAATTDGAAWFDLEREVGLRLRITGSSSLSLPGSGTLSLRYAEKPGSKQKEGSQP